MASSNPRDRRGERRLSRLQASPPAGRDHEEEVRPLLQPETRPITQEQLETEVKGIYAGVVMVEKKCVEIDAELAQTTDRLNNEQWQALIALHRTLLHEHHDFFLASQHPKASAALQRLPTKYAMPARMWRHGIHSFLELLRHRLPYSLEHMLSFAYLAYQMMGLLMESVPPFYNTWIECLGDLARYRMAIEQVDLRDRKHWSNISRMWYEKAADNSPDTGRIQHHIAVTAKAAPDIVCQLFYYSKALIAVDPFLPARCSIMLLLTPLLESSEPPPSRYSKLESSLVTAAGFLFTKGSVDQYCIQAEQFTSELERHIARSGCNWKTQGPQVASVLIAFILGFGSDDNYLWKAFRANHDRSEVSQQEASIDAEDCRHASPPPQHRVKDKFTSADEVTSYGLQVWSQAITIVAGALIYVENHVPWTVLVLFLNSLSRSGVTDALVESKEFPRSSFKQLPEDFPIRGLVWAPYYFPSNFFEGEVVDQDDRALELPSYTAPRTARCLWLGVRLASLNRYMTYDTSTKQFGCTKLASQLAENTSMRVQTPTTTECNVQMTDV
ncbi:hypothetical protein AYL99_11655 [Fonsecaea erecta]|uniref:DNA/RNA-binding domain-containing protein n=1 Tax=Fonsecaea erecta TaxID=1367422 RepID=A0A178Z2X6_9EURO|nr:hypothetical protein AYL99_11655 [Fonsecaea erecta]OAP54120.1 hypothetical protein AYL99_11655 [Fonsecaea erecta]